MDKKPDVQFSDWLGAHGGGALNDKLTAAMRDVAEAVVLLDKPGKVTLQLSLTAKGGGIIVAPKVAFSVPEGKESGQFYFLAADGSLSRRDPSQPQLPTMEDTK